MKYVSLEHVICHHVTTSEKLIFEKHGLGLFKEKHNLQIGTFMKDPVF